MKTFSTKKFAPVVLVAALAIAGLYVYRQQTQNVLPDGIAQSNGRLELNRLDIASLYPGRVEKMLVDEGEQVQKGDVLAELSSDTSTSRLTSAQAQKQRAQEAAMRAAAEVKTYQQRQKVAQLELDNALALKRQQLVSDSEVKRRQAERDSAAAAVQAARAAQAEAQASIAAAQAQTDEAASADNDMRIKSPIAGIVEYRIAEVGSVLASGSKVVSLLDPSDISMNIFLSNTQMSTLKVGDEARIVLDGMDAVFPARISFIASDAQFTPKSVETAHERAKLMFKVKLKIPAETALQHQGLLKGGMTGNGYVRTNAQTAWPAHLAEKLPKEPTTP